jgi:hypothetical protein
MKVEKLINLAHDVYQGFDPSRTGKNQVENILLKVFDKRITHIQNVLTKVEEEEEFVRLVYTEIPWAYFGLGYAMGQIFDLTDPEVQKTVEAIQQEIRKKGLLPYLSRERAA